MILPENRIFTISELATLRQCEQKFIYSVSQEKKDSSFKRVIPRVFLSTLLTYLKETYVGVKENEKPALEIAVEKGLGKEEILKVFVYVETFLKDWIQAKNKTKEFLYFPTFKTDYVNFFTFQYDEKKDLVILTPVIFRLLEFINPSSVALVDVDEALNLAVGETGNFSKQILEELNFLGKNYVINDAIIFETLYEKIGMVKDEKAKDFLARLRNLVIFRELKIPTEEMNKFFFIHEIFKRKQREGNESLNRLWHERNYSACASYKRVCPYFTKCHGVEYLEKKTYDVSRDLKEKLYE